MHIILIPAYNPDEKLLKLLKELKKLKIMVVDDGSDKNSQKIFAEIKKNKEITLLTHKENQGKGAALKTGFGFFIKNFEKDSDGIITVDADGQHTPEDVEKLLAKAQNKKNYLLLGSRQKTGKMPLRSKFGNILTRFIFRAITSLNIHDTQTGLRVIPKSLLKKLLEIKSNAYEFELEMLLLVKKLKIKIKEYPIKTIYIEDNASSHFNPLIDSIKIYFVFFRFIGSSILTSAIDYIVFIITHLITANILTSFVIARICACIFNFTFNKRAVFKSKDTAVGEITRYIALVILLMSVAYFAVNFLSNTYGINVYLAKIISEGSLFMLSFAIQHLVVFKKK